MKVPMFSGRDVVVRVIKRTGHWAVTTHATSRGYFDVTHIPTGYAVFARRYPLTRKRAGVALRRFAAIPDGDFATPESMSPAFAVAGGALQRELIAKWFKA